MREAVTSAGTVLRLVATIRTLTPWALPVLLGALCALLLANLVPAVGHAAGGMLVAALLTLALVFLPE